MKELIGKKIKAIYIAEGENYLAFDTDLGVVAYEGYGDCCSETWFADITGVNALIGGVVKSVEDIELPQDPDDNRSRQEHDEVYGYKLVTDKGYADIVYRNSSNGYYGGSCDPGVQVSDPKAMFASERFKSRSDVQQMLDVGIWKLEKA